MRKLLMGLLAIEPSPVEQCFDPAYRLDPPVPPSALLRALSDPTNLATFITTINRQEKSGLRLLRKLSIVHHCLIHFPELCEGLQEVDFSQQSSDAWMNEHVLKPYQQFLQRVVCAEEQYRKSLPQGVLEISFERLFFVASLLSQMFHATQKIAALARYYRGTESRQAPVMSDFVCLCACHAQSLYSTFRSILSQMVRFPSAHITSAHHKQMLRFLLQDELVRINQEMKSLFLDKYFFPYGKGYGVKLLRVEEMPEASLDYAQQLLHDQPAPVRRPKPPSLNSILFDSSGRLNPEVYAGLAQMRLLDESMRVDGANSSRLDRSQRCERVEQI